VGRSLVSYLNFSSFVILSVKNVIMIESSSWGFCEVYLGADLGDLPEEAAAAAKLHQSCPTLCDPIDSNPPGSPVPGILQARTLEWVAISFFNAWKWKVKSESEVAQLGPTSSKPMDCSRPGSSVHGIFQARILEWGAIAFSRSQLRPAKPTSQSTTSHMNEVTQDQPSSPKLPADHFSPEQKASQISHRIMN